MQETRREAIEWKIITKDDLRRIANIITREATHAERANANYSCEFQVACSDGTSYESTSDEILEENQILDLKRSVAISFGFWRRMEDGRRSIDFSVQRGGGYSDRLTISGPERNWVRGTYTELSEILNAIKPQTAWPLRHPTLTLWALAAGVGCLGNTFWDIVYRYISNPVDLIITPSMDQHLKTLHTTHPLLFALLGITLIWLFRVLSGLAFAPALRRWIENLWPRIEFDFGPEHTQTEKIRRQKILAVWIGVATSVIASILMDSLRLI